MFDWWFSDTLEEGDSIAHVVPEQDFIQVIPGTIADIDTEGGRLVKARAKLNDDLSTNNSTEKRYTKHPDKKGRPVSSYSWVTKASELPLYDSDYPYFFSPYALFEDHEGIDPNATRLRLRKLRVSSEVVLPGEVVKVCKHPTEDIEEVSANQAARLSVWKVGAELEGETALYCMKCNSIVG